MQQLMKRDFEMLGRYNSPTMLIGQFQVGRILIHCFSSIGLTVLQLFVVACRQHLATSQGTLSHFYVHLGFLFTSSSWSPICFLNGSLCSYVIYKSKNVCQSKQFTNNWIQIKHDFNFGSLISDLLKILLSGNY